MAHSLNLQLHCHRELDATRGNGVYAPVQLRSWCQKSETDRSLAIVARPAWPRESAQRTIEDDFTHATAVFDPQLSNTATCIDIREQRVSALNREENILTARSVMHHFEPAERHDGRPHVTAVGMLARCCRMCIFFTLGNTQLEQLRPATFPSCWCSWAHSPPSVP